MPFVSPESFAKQTIASVQDYSILCWRAVANLFSRPRYWADIYTQMDSIGVGSMPIVVLNGFFTGCVLALQSATSLQAFGSVSLTGNLVALSMVKELGPVLTGLMVSGRNASGMASEIGSMQVTEQIDEFVGELDGVKSIESQMVFTPPWSPAKMSEDAKFALGY